MPSEQVAREWIAENALEAYFSELESRQLGIALAALLERTRDEALEEAAKKADFVREIFEFRKSKKYSYCDLDDVIKQLREIARSIRAAKKEEEK
jgi:hypothetical protein